MTASHRAWSKFFADKTGVAALIVVLLFLLTAVGMEIYTVVCEAGNITPAYMVSDDLNCYAPPSAKHWCGTDYQGRDVALRALAGSVSALKVGVIAGLIAVTVGTLLGSCAGFFGGKFDDFTVWLYSVFSAMPTLLFILAFALLVSQQFLSPPLLKIFKSTAAILHVEPGMLGVYIAIGLTGWIGLCRVIRSEAMKLKNCAFVNAARCAGVGNLTIIRRHILPNVFHLVIIYFTTLFAGAVMLEVIASYLGLGAQTFPSWGVMISDGQQRLWAGVWWELATASGLLFLLVLALNILGDSLAAALDPRR